VRRRFGGKAVMRFYFVPFRGLKGSRGKRWGKLRGVHFWLKVNPTFQEATIKKKVLDQTKDQ